MLGWAYYGEKCFSYLFGNSAIKFYRFIFVIAVFIGAVSTLDAVWRIADIMNGLMAFPNLVGLLGLSGVVVAETRRFKKKRQEERGRV
ncbi:MAG TPA: alanine:cation symporter family protein [Bacillus bacterium]|nr:alanine:cation symporter family protein [Bacillus sp. (in: firmicutes)]